MIWSGFLRLCYLHEKRSCLSFLLPCVSMLTASVPQLARLSWNKRNKQLAGRLHTRQKNPEMVNWPVIHSGLEIFWNKLGSAVHVDANFLLFFIFLFLICFPLACCCSGHNLWILFQIYNNLISSPPFSALALCLSPGFSSVPEDLLPDFDLKIMPGRGVIYSPPYLVLHVHANLI